MTIIMNDSHMLSITQIKEFVKVARNIEFQGACRKEKYQWIEKIIYRFGYFRLRKKDKSILKTYIAQMTGYSDAQLTRLIAKKKKCGKIIADSTERHKFPTTYNPQDIARLIETDKAHQRLSGPATKKILEREYTIFHHQAFERLQYISPAHIYNLRGTRQYQSQTTFFTKTRPVKINIGQRCKPETYGKPGYIRVDTVHQGDLYRAKGIYHINMVDEVTQWEVVGAVEKISEHYLVSLLEELIGQYPFYIRGFHSDNGSEYINKIVAKLLNKLLIKQTKSRARHCNDNALVEGKNGAIIRKNMGYAHIPQKHAPRVNRFYRNHLNVYLNYHRPCGFSTIITDKKGKQKKVYKTYQIPYERLKSLPYAEHYLREGITFEILDKIAYEKSDNECAALMQKAKVELFKSFHYTLQLPITYAIPAAVSANCATPISGSYLD